jgi:TM2 domain-containing membrane protein YozV
MNDSFASGAAPPDAFSMPAATLPAPPPAPAPLATGRAAAVGVSRSPGIALLLSFFIPGAGQLYNGEIGKGVAFIVANALAFVLTLAVIGFFLLPVVWIWSLVDAYQVAKR